MGNQLSAPPRFQPEHLQELQDRPNSQVAGVNRSQVVYKQSLGGARAHCALAPPASSSAALELTGTC